MTEKMTALSRPLVVGRKRDGRRCYDPEAKRELVEVCLRPGISVAGMALAHGINANLLRKWIDHSRSTAAMATAEPAVALPSFVPVVSITTPEPSISALSVALPNGVQLELRDLKPDDLPPLLTCLVGLPCSASNRG
jgi:transposase